MAETEVYKAKRKRYAKMLKHYQEWLSLVESENIQTLPIGENGEEIHYMDVRDALRVLPPRQYEAVRLMCLEDLSEQEVAVRMGFTKWPTPVQQYKNFGLKRLIDYIEGDSELRNELKQKSKKYHGQR